MELKGELYIGLLQASPFRFWPWFLAKAKTL